MKEKDRQTGRTHGVSSVLLFTIHSYLQPRLKQGRTTMNRQIYHSKLKAYTLALIQRKVLFFYYIWHRGCYIFMSQVSYNSHGHVKWLNEHTGSCGVEKNICLASCTTKIALSFHMSYTLSQPSSPLALPRLKNKVKPKTECDMRSCQAQLGSTAGGQSYVWKHRVTEWCVKCLSGTL